MSTKTERTAKIVAILDKDGKLARAYRAVHVVYIDDAGNVESTMAPVEVDMTEEELRAALA